MELILFTSTPRAHLGLEMQKGLGGGRQTGGKAASNGRGSGPQD